MSHHRMKPIKYIKAAELVASFQNGSSKNYLVVDVREHDYTIGKIPGSIPIPFHSFNDHLQELRDQAKDYQEIIFHCYFSQTRGPTAAQQFASFISDSDLPIEIKVLQGGWKTWYKYCHLHNLENLIEGIENDRKEL